MVAWAIGQAARSSYPAAARADRRALLLRRMLSAAVLLMTGGRCAVLAPRLAVGCRLGCCWAVCLPHAAAQRSVAVVCASCRRKLDVAEVLVLPAAVAAPLVPRCDSSYNSSRSPLLVRGFFPRRAQQVAALATPRRRAEARRRAAAAAAGGGRRARRLGGNHQYFFSSGGATDRTDDDGSAAAVVRRCSWNQPSAGDSTRVPVGGLITAVIHYYFASASAYFALSICSSLVLRR